MAKIIIKESDFRIEWYSGTGKGGQHRNKHQNCCRVIHEPTGIQANGTRNRSRDANKRDAFSVCVSRVVAHHEQDTERYRATNERVRTYHEPDNRVIDHRSGEVDTYKHVVLENNLGDMIIARKLAMSEE